MSDMFSQLLAMAEQQEQPQRLLFLFAKAESASKKNASDKDPKSGTIEPRMCVDKLPKELSDYAALIKEADSVEKDWNFVFVAGLSGQNGFAPTTEMAEQYLNKMTNDLSSGKNIAQYVVFDREGQPIEMMVN
jgi:hypothetical protein